MRMPAARCMGLPDRKNISAKDTCYRPSCGAGSVKTKKTPLPEAPFLEEARCPLFGLRRRLGVCLLEMLVLLLHQDVEFLLLLVVQRATHLVDGAFADGVDFLDLVVAGHGAILNDVHGLGVLIFESGLDLGLLVGGKVQLLGQGLHLIVNAGMSGHLSALRLGCGPVLLLPRLRVLVLSGLSLWWLG